MKLHELLKVISGDVKICIDGREYGNPSTDVELDIKRIDVTTANFKGDLDSHGYSFEVGV